MADAEFDMNRRDFCKALVSVPLLSGCAGSGLALVKRLNVVLITVDDMNYNSVGVYGCSVENITPNIDRLASEGMRFTQSHVNTAICQPSRQTMLTGRYAHRHSRGGFTPIFNDVPTLTEKLHEAGYLNGIVCKERHYAPRKKFNWDFCAASNHMQQGRNPKLFYQSTLKFIQNAQAQNKPFFLSANSQDPHRPFAQSACEKRMFPNANFPVSRVISPEEIDVPGFLPDLPDVRKEIAQYYTSCYRGDESVGAILQAIRDAGVEDQTMVIFLSDNGIAMPFAKTNCYLNSTRTSLIIRWPGRTQAGTVTDCLAAGIDLTPTILDAVGLKPIDGADGCSLVPLIDGKQTECKHYVFTEFHETNGRKQYPMRAVHDGKYGYVINFWADGNTVFCNESQKGLTFNAMRKSAETDGTIASRVKLFEFRVLEEFYDFSKDPDGLDNCIDLPEYKLRIERLTDALEKHLYNTKDPAVSAFTNRHDPKAIRVFMQQTAFAGQKAE